MIADEGGVLSNLDSQQTRAAWIVSAKRRFILDGTPIGSYSRDILPLLAFTVGHGTASQPYGIRHRPFLAPCLRTSAAYAERGIDRFRDDFVTLEWVTNEFQETLREGAKREIPRIRNLPKYRALLSPHVKRRVDQEPDVARDVCIPVPQEITTTLDWDDTHLDYYLAISESFADWYRRYRADTLERGINTNLVAILARILAVEIAANAPMKGVEGFGAYRALTSKDRYILDRVDDLASKGHKTIVYARFPETLERLGRELSSQGLASVLFHGEIPIAKRTQALNDHFRFGDAPVLLASFGVAQRGLNIPQANRVIGYNRRWTAKEERQAWRRVLRPQQQREVVIETVHLAGGIDTYQAQMVAHKADCIDAGLDWGTPQLDGVDFLHLDTIFGRFIEDLTAMSGTDRRSFSRTPLRLVS
jgi:hypothetical protein